MPGRGVGEVSARIESPVQWHLADLHGTSAGSVGSGFPEPTQTQVQGWFGAIETLLP